MSNGKEITATIKPNPTPITIDPGQKHEFEIIWERDWTGHVEPGLWTMWVEDESFKFESNHIEIPLIFTVDSAAACLEIASDYNQSIYKRKNYAEWTQKIMPELTFRWWENEMSAQEKQQMETEVQRQLELFRSFLNDKSKAEAIHVAISLINRESGVDTKK